MIVAVMGPSGSGKSFIARILHEEFGFEWIRSDEIRKELAGLKPEVKVKEAYGKGIYSEDFTRRVYEEMINRAKRAVKEGKKVVLDATFIEEWQRDLLKANFPEVVILLAWADEEEIIRRLKERVDISDADIEIYRRQKERFVAPKEAIRIETKRSKEELISALRELLQSIERKST